MTCPNKAQIVQKAIELFHKERFRNGDPCFSVTPTTEELSENGFIQTARSMLMTDQYRSQVEGKDYVENLEDFTFDVSEALQNGIYTVGTRGCGKSDLNMMLAEKLQKQGIIVITFDPSLDWVKRSNIQNYVTVQPYAPITIPNESMVYDLSTIAPLQQREFVERFNRALVEYQINSTKEQWYFCIFEEAHTYFYQGSMRSKAMQYTVRALTQGRNFRISMALISQFSSMLDKDTMKFMNQRFFGVSNEPNDISYLKGFLNKHAQELKTLDSGEFLYFNKGKISKVSIEPYETTIQKQQITIPQSAPIEPIKPKQETNIVNFLRLGMIIFFVILFLYVLSKMR
jgi:hypothetical protein